MDGHGLNLLFGLRESHENGSKRSGSIDEEGVAVRLSCSAHT